MIRMLVLLLLVASAPLAARMQTVERDDPIDRWNHFIVGGIDDRRYLPLTLGPDRTGLGLRVRTSMGWDDNIYRMDRNEDQALFMDGFGDIYSGANFSMLSVGARLQASGRVYFGEPEASLWDLRLGAFVKKPYDGGLGFGVTGDALFQQIPAYEIGGPIERRDALRAYGVTARGYAGVALTEALIAEAGLRGQITEFSEREEFESLDSWEIGLDAMLYIHLLNFAQVRPYLIVDYESFRELEERRTDGTERTRSEELELLKFKFGVDAKIDLGFAHLAGGAYGKRTDDSAAGFIRHWEFGLQAAADLFMVDGWRLSLSADMWNREYDDRVETPGETVTERYLRAYGELAWNMWEFVHVGGRYTYERRISSISNGGYATNEAVVFLEFIF
jgi:hypothetical protein